MHEAAISKALLAQLSSLADQQGWSRLRQVTLKIGLLSGVVPEALDFAFGALSQGTPAEGATLVMRTEPGRFSCGDCGDLELDRLNFICPRCHGPLRLLEAGRDLLLCGVEPMPLKP